ncbi:BON domain-containing protein [Isosphaeraceae bacterium EP7]
MAESDESQPADGMIDGAVRKVAQGIEDASTTVRDRYDMVVGATRNGALASEVNSRLRQDRALESGRIDVQVEEEGTVILKGQVPDAESKNHAVESTREIRGVVRVEDHLAVPPTPRVYNAPTGVAATSRTRRIR